MSSHHAHDGAKQPHIFSHERAEMLDDPEREAWLPTQTLIALAGVEGGMRVLDFGAGTGRYALPLARAHSDAEVSAYDVQPEFLAMIDERAREAGLENVRVTARPEGAFERILAANVLHEIGDEDLLIMRAALADGGFALILDWDAEIDRPTGPPREHAHTRAEAVERLRRAGFTRIKTIGEPKLPYHFVFSAS